MSWRSIRHDPRGYNLVEFLTVLVMVTILIGIASPFFVQWRRDLDSRKEARAAYDLLRQARSRALSTNFQHMVSFEPAAARFRMVRGDRAYNTPVGGWQESTWQPVSSGVSLTSGAGDDSNETVYVQFNADGTARLQKPAGTDIVPPASTVTLCFQGGSGTKNLIEVATCGRISLR